MPAKIFPGGGGETSWAETGGPSLAGRKFIKTGAYRPPKAGEFFLSSARESVAVQAGSDFHGPYYILREATEEEARCPGCGQSLPYSETP